MFLSLLWDKNTINLLQHALQQNISQIISTASNYVANVWTFVVNAIWWFFSAIFQIIMVFVLAIFFSLEKDKVILFLSSISNNKLYFKRKIEKLYYIILKEKLKNYIIN